MAPSSNSNSTPTSDPEQVTRCDVAIVGAGFAGTTAAASLSRSGLSVALIDLQRHPAPALRVEKFSAEQLPLLNAVGILDSLTAVTSVATQAVNIRGRNVIDRETVEDHGLLYPDTISVLRDQLPTSAQFIQGKATALDLNEDGGTVSLSDGRSIEARLVVLATGQARALRESVGIERRVVHPTPTVTVAFTLRPPPGGFRFPSMAAYGEVAGDGVDYTSIFPVGNAMRVNVFMFTAPSDPRIVAFKRDPMTALLQLQPGLARWLAGSEVIDAAEFFSLQISMCDKALRPGLVLIGDAYRTSCPAVGNGLSCLLVDVERLHHYAMRWMATPGMSVEKIAAFYADPVKSSLDRETHRLAIERRRSVLTTSLVHRARRAIHFNRRRVSSALTSRPAIDMPRRAADNVQVDRI